MSANNAPVFVVVYDYTDDAQIELFAKREDAIACVSKIVRDEMMGNDENDELVIFLSTIENCKDDAFGPMQLSQETWVSMRKQEVRS